MSRRRTLSWLALLPLVAGCGTPRPNSLVRLDVPGAERWALATEDGIVALNGDDLGVDVVPILYWYNASPVTDDATVVHRTAELALLRPASTKLEYNDWGATQPEPGESLWIQVLDDDPEHRPLLIDAELFAGGRYGDLLEIDEWFTDPERVAAEFAGAGVFARRKGRYVLVGILTGAVADDPRRPGFWQRVFGPETPLAFVGLDAIAPVLPETSDFFKRRVRVFRPDFEYGLLPDGSEWEPPNR